MATREQVIGLYKSVLGRDPYAAELAPGGWVDKYTRSGRDVNGLTQVFQNSNEYKQKQSATNPVVNPVVSQTAQNPLDPTDAQITQASAGQNSLLEAQAAEEKQNAQDSNTRLIDSLAKVYGRNQQSDPYGNMGIMSGAAQQYQNQEMGNQVADSNRTLTQQLSTIARNLGAQKLSIRDTVTNQLRDRALQNQQYQSNKIAQVGTAGDIYTKLLDSNADISPEIWAALQRAVGGI